ncbi:nucleotidyltransferase domain-containing protein [Arthrobacter sp. 754]|uniref:nucleotidyltransferase domain-containing protein n=1 Tax=Arthrobacter sp. 754 TaxID=3156315 RepID=UPI00339B55D0
MKSTVPLLAPLLRSNLQGDVLAVLLLSPEEQWNITALAERVATNLPSVLREINRLLQGGIVRERKLGRNRMISANRAHPLFHPLVQMLEYSYGPLVVLPEILSGISGVEKAYIYGSWAARHEGVEGTDPADIDVLVVGTPNRLAIADAAEAASRRLGREVNIRTISAESWKDDSEYFIRSIKERPILELDVERGSDS